MYLNSRLSITAVSVISLLFTLCTMGKFAAAQTDVKITVDGPWAYAADPADPKNRIIIIAPRTQGHLDAESYPEPSGHGQYFPVGYYHLDIPTFSSSNCDSASSSNASFYKISVKRLAIDEAINAADRRYAFSLPKPCYYRERYHHFAKISGTEITTPDDQVVGDTYSTTVELHYSVSSITSAHITGTSDDKRTSYDDWLDFKGTQLQFIMAGYSDNSDFDCDSTSASSFLDEIGLFGETRYVWFPYLDDSGDQAGNKGHYLNNCQTSNARKAIQRDAELARTALYDIKVVQLYAARPQAVSQQLALASLDDISTAVNSLNSASLLPRRPGDPERPAVLDVQRELSATRNMLLSLSRGDSPAGPQAPSSAPEKHEPVLHITYRFVMFSASGSGDCHGAQTFATATP